MNLEEILEEETKTHWIDVYNRRLAIQALRPVLNGTSPSYLDVGPGAGYMVEEVEREFPHADIFKQQYQPPLFDVQDCKFSDNAFDAVSCLNVLEHLQSDWVAVKQIHRILKPGGLAVFTVPMGENLFDFYDGYHGHYRRYSLGELAHMVKRHGFKIIHQNHFAVVPYPLFWLVKRWNQIFPGDLSSIRRQMRGSRSGLMDFYCRIEMTIGARIIFPFGVRGIIVGTKL